MGLTIENQLAVGELGEEALASRDRNVMLDCLEFFIEMLEDIDFDSNLLFEYINKLKLQLLVLYGSYSR